MTTGVSQQDYGALTTACCNERADLLRAGKVKAPLQGLRRGEGFAVRGLDRVFRSAKYAGNGSVWVASVHELDQAEGASGIGGYILPVLSGAWGKATSFARPNYGAIVPCHHRRKHAVLQAPL
jgi:hypothetical protein